MRWRIEVPATLSNLGSGYDALGVAIGLSNTFQAEPAATWSVGGRPVDPASHLVLATALAVQRAVGARPAPLDLAGVDERVPRSRGLGSSATARVAGLLAGLEAAGARLDERDRLSWLAEAEGHPDNAWPALLGGCVVCGDRPKRLAVHPSWSVALCVPSVEVSTPAARRVLPAEVPHRDAVFNVRNAALLVAGLLDGDADAVREGVGDRLHQPWRIPLIGPVDASFERARALGAAPFVSGSGSTLAAFVPAGTDARAVAGALAAPFRDRGIPAEERVERPRERGATVAGGG